MTYMQTVNGIQFQIVIRDVVTAFKIPSYFIKSVTTDIINIVITEKMSHLH